METSGQEEGIIEESTIEPTLSMRLNEVLLRNSCAFDECKIYLYKYEGYNSGSQKALIETFHGEEPPDESEIGYEYGSGRYQMIIFPPPKNGKKDPEARSYTFRLGRTYDNKRRQQEAPGNHQVVVHDSGGGINNTMKLFESFIHLITPLIVRPQSEDMGKMMVQQYSGINEIMKQQALDNMGLLNDMVRRIQELEPVDTTEQIQVEENGGGDQVAGVLEQIIPLVSEWLPKILGGGIEGQVAAAGIKAAPMFKRIRRDRQTIKALVSYLDQTQGAETTNQLLAKLGMARPVPVSAPRKALAVPATPKRRRPPIKRTVEKGNQPVA